MPSRVAVNKTVTIGDKEFLQSVSAKRPFGVVFEDDGETGYFYALDLSNGSQTIVDALFIYDVKSVVDRYKPSLIQIIWSANGARAALQIDGVPQAVFDCEAQRGWCRTGFPPSSTKWSREGHQWDEAVMEVFE